MTTTTLPYSAITIDNAVNIRDELHEPTVVRYVAIFDQLPAPVVYRLLDGTYLLTDGFHGMEAAQRLRLEEVAVEVREGTRLEAEELAIVANTDHGRPYSRAERREAIKRMLRLHPEWSNRRLAAKLGVDGKTVGVVRAEMELAAEIPQLELLVGADGKGRPRQRGPDDASPEEMSPESPEAPADTPPPPNYQVEPTLPPAQNIATTPQPDEASPNITWTIHNAELLEWARSYDGSRFHNLISDPPYSFKFLGLTWDKPRPQGNFSYRDNTATVSDGEFKGLRLPRPNRVANVRCLNCTRWQVDHHCKSCESDKPDFPNAGRHQMLNFQHWVTEWATALIDKVLYPGAVCAFCGGVRTHHRLMAGLEDAGFEIFDVVIRLHSQGMTKGKNLDKAQDERAFKEWLASTNHSLSPAEARLACSAAVQGGVTIEERYGRSFKQQRNPHGPVQMRNLGAKAMRQGKALLAGLIEKHWNGPVGTLPPGVRARIGERIERSGFKSVNRHNAQIGYRQVDYYEGKGDTLSVTEPATEEALRWAGYNTTLKPDWEPVILCRAPRQGLTYVELARRYGTGALNIDASRIPVYDDEGVWGSSNVGCKSGFNDSQAGREYRSRQHSGGRWPPNVVLSHVEGCKPVGVKKIKGITGSKSGSWRRGHQYSGGWRGADQDELGQKIGYAGADGQETIEAWACLCRCNDCQAEWSAENLVACPACDSPNIAWRCPVRMLDAQVGPLKSGANNVHGGSEKGYSGWKDQTGRRQIAYGDEGSASRFFYVSKVSPWEGNAGVMDMYWQKDSRSPTGFRSVDRATWETLPEGGRRRGNMHPTKKPVRLISEYIAPLILPPRHIKPRVFVPFFGSGSEGVGVMMAAKALGVEVEIVGVENEVDYCVIGEGRMRWWGRFDGYEEARKAWRGGG